MNTNRPAPHRPRRAAALLALVALQACAPGNAPGEEGIVRTALHDFRVEEVADGLVRPFSMAFTPEGDLLVTERPGRLRIIREGVLLPDSVEGLPPIRALGRGARSMSGFEQAGLRDAILHPDFAANRLLYLSYVKPGADSLGTIAIARARFENDRLSDVEELFHADAFGNGTDRSSMWGGRLAFDHDGYLFMTLGDRQWPSAGDLAAHPAQDLSNHNGSTIRLYDDGRVPEDNPLVGEAGVHPEIWTWGHRNAQGMAVHPETGELWQNEHGPQGGDELNLIEPGRNYGWPVVGYGVNYRTGSRIHSGTLMEGMAHPAHIWVPSIGVSGMLFYTGDAFPAWRGDMLVGGLSGRRLARLRMEGREVVHEETLLRGIGRIRDVRQGPEGFVYLAIDGETRDVDGPPTGIIRLVPAGRR